MVAVAVAVAVAALKQENRHATDAARSERFSNPCARLSSAHGGWKKLLDVQFPVHRNWRTAIGRIDTYREKPSAPKNGRK
jgi:hypothetical protein